MKVERRTVKRVVFIASDGTEFNTKLECCKYEKNLQREECERIIEKIPTIPDTFPGGDDFYTRQFYFVRNCFEMDALTRFLFCDDAAANEFVPEKYPTWVLCIWDDDGYGGIDDADGYLSEIESYVAGTKERLHNLTPLEYRLDTFKKIE